MPKEKKRKEAVSKNYFKTALGILLLIFCILIIGRVGKITYIALVLSFILGDFSTLIVVIFSVYVVKDLIFNSKTDLHHIYLIGAIFIFLGLSMLCHLGLYDSLSMSNTNIINKTLGLYSRYFKHFDYSYSCGGGIIAALLVQAVAFFSGKVGVIMIALSFIGIGISYIMDLKMFKLLKGKRLKTIIINSYKTVINYFSNIKGPKNENVKIPLNILMDNDEPVTFTLQNEINKEKYENLKEYIRSRHLYCVLDKMYTSFTSSRYKIRLANKNDNTINELSGFFDKKCFFIKNNLELSIDVPNQFKKLLTLKNMLVESNDIREIPFFVEVEGEAIAFDFTNGRILSIIGERTSGVKTCIRAFIATLLIKGHKPKNIYMYDLYQEFIQLKGKSINYIKGPNDIEEAFEEAFREYERRLETLRYLACDNVSDANKKIIAMGKELELIEPIFHIIYFNEAMFNQSLIMKLSYVTKLANRVGINIILVFRNRADLFKVNTINGDIISFYTSDVTASIKIFGSDIACRLQKKGDVLVLSGNTTYHGQAPYISLDDFENIINCL